MDTDIIAAPDSKRVISNNHVVLPSDDDISADIITDKRVAESCSNVNYTSNKRRRKWVADFDLSFQDKSIIQNNKWLNCDIMLAAHQLVNQQLSGIGGLQETYKKPVLVKNKWHYEFEMQPISECYAAQIHHNDAQHWVMSIKTDNKVYICDSLVKESCPITPSLEIQISALYGDGLDKLEVLLPTNNQQSNSYDCGVYAIANLFNFCLACRDKKTHVFLNEELNSSGMRYHLLKCFENQTLLKFPSSSLPNSKPMKKVVIHMDCVKCRFSNCFDDMIACSKCKGWIHMSCAEISIPEPVPNIWFCGSCAV